MEEAKKLGIERMKKLINKRIEKYQKVLQQLESEEIQPEKKPIPIDYEKYID